MDTESQGRASTLAQGAIEANLFSFFSLMRAWPQLEIHDEPELLWSISDIPFPLFNSILRANLSPSLADDAIEEAISRCRSRHVPMLWWTGPSTCPPDLPTHLLDHGFQGEDARGMAVSWQALGNEPLKPPGFVVDQVTDLDTMGERCSVLCEGFEMPSLVGEAFLDLSRVLGLGPGLPLRHFIGRLEGAAVALSSLFLGAGVGGIYNVVTLPRARRRGIGAVMTFAALRAAAHEGCRFAILHSTEMGAAVYRGLGFEEYCTIGQFVWTGEG
jgi:GNAT superfamily N-acetyltransferase